jgi:hypothetical protein
MAARVQSGSRSRAMVSNSPFRIGSDHSPRSASSSLGRWVRAVDLLPDAEWEAAVTELIRARKIEVVLAPGDRWRPGSSPGRARARWSRTAPSGSARTTRPAERADRPLGAGRRPPARRGVGGRGDGADPRPQDRGGGPPRSPRHRRSARAARRGGRSPRAWRGRASGRRTSPRPWTCASRCGASSKPRPRRPPEDDVEHRIPFGRSPRSGFRTRAASRRAGPGSRRGRSPAGAGGRPPSPRRLPPCAGPTTGRVRRTGGCRRRPSSPT